jgi:hypothetical protein
MKDGLIEKIGFYKTLITIFWSSFFLLGGGLFNFMYNIHLLFEIIALVVGCIAEICFFIIPIVLMFRCKRLIRQVMEIKTDE